jgi:hypothetical protein
MNFLGTQDRRRIGGKIGIPRPGRKNNDPPFFQMPDGTSRIYGSATSCMEMAVCVRV